VISNNGRSNAKKKEEHQEQLLDICKTWDKIFIHAHKTLQEKNKQQSMYFRAIVGSYLLDLKKKTYCILEKYVYDIAMHHIDRLQLSNRTDIFIQFWLKSGDLCKTTPLHQDWHMYGCDNTENNQCISTITYLTDNIRPTLFTDITIDDKENATFDTFNKIALLFPRTFNHVSFLGTKYFHGHYDVFPEEQDTSRGILAVKIWIGLQPKLLPFEPELFSLESTYEKDVPLLQFIDNTKETHIQLPDNRYIHSDFFHDVIFSGSKKACYPFGTIIQNNGYNKYDLFYIEKGPDIYIPEPTELFNFPFLLLLVLCILCILVCYSSIQIKVDDVVKGSF
jgi:hypothetical protein